MLKTFKYRLYPKRSQETKLNETLDICRFVYNKTLEIRKDAWETEHKTVSYFQTAKLLSPWKEQDPSLDTVHSQVLQDVMIRVDLAYKAFFRRLKSGDKPGYPRFRGKFRYDSFNYRQSGFNIHPDSTLYLSKIGRIPIILHRYPAPGKMKNCTIQRTRTGKWFASIVIDTSRPKDLPKTGKIAGLDMGLKTYIMASDGYKVPRQRFFKTDEDALAKAQRRFSKFPKTESSPDKDKARKVVARVHERIKDRRDNFCHQTANKLVHRYDFMAVEDLDTKEMLEQKKWSKSIADASWAQLLQRLSNKAVEAGKTVVTINPRNTSQMCSQCRALVPKDISVRVHDCPHCGLKIDRDLNASLNILRLGMQSVEYRDFAVKQCLDPVS
jgi:putative transposase